MSKTQFSKFNLSLIFNRFNTCFNCLLSTKESKAAYTKSEVIQTKDI